MPTEINLSKDSKEIYIYQDGNLIGHWVKPATPITELPIINLNDTVYVKLTEKGRQVYYNYIKEINNYYQRDVIKNYEPSYEGEYAYFQLWDFMRIFGQYMYAGCDNVIEPLDMYIKKP